jgi:hypothetical protein
VDARRSSKKLAFASLGEGSILAMLGMEQVEESRTMREQETQLEEFGSA